MENQDQTYETKNLFIASFLMASQRVDFAGLRDLDYKTKLFTFSPASLARELEADYFSGKPLPAKTLFAEYNTLKDLLFQRDSYEEEKRYGYRK